MSIRRSRVVVGLALVGVVVPTIALSQPEIPLSSRAIPKPVPVAETKLLMDGIVNANFKGLEKTVKSKPEDVEAWTFARGQALLIAEAGNLLLMRPPKLGGQDVWNKTSVEMREAATNLAKAAAARDPVTSQARLSDLATVCNKCHQSFRVATRVTPFRDEK